MSKAYKFKKLPAYAAYNIDHTSSQITPNEVYEYAKVFRTIYERSKRLSQKVDDYGYVPLQKWSQLNGIPQALAVQLSLANELLLKAILLGSTGEFYKGHSLRKLISKLDKRYEDIIKKHLEGNALKPGHWNKVLKSSDNIFVKARYGFESGKYRIDFMILQLLNEALDDIYLHYLPEWITISELRHKNKTTIKNEINLVFNEEYQKQIKGELRAFHKAFSEYTPEG